MAATFTSGSRPLNLVVSHARHANGHCPEPIDSWASACCGSCRRRDTRVTRAYILGGLDCVGGLRDRWRCSGLFVLASPSWPMAAR